MDVVQGVHAERQVGNALNSAVVTVRNETKYFSVINSTHNLFMHASFTFYIILY